MGSKHITKTNPMGNVQHCQQRGTHESHEWQGTLSTWHNVWCPGIDGYPPDLHHITRERAEVFEERVRNAQEQAWEVGHQLHADGCHCKNPFARNQ